MSFEPKRRGAAWTVPVPPDHHRCEERATKEGAAAKRPEGERETAHE
jgi:hypothetical protein